MGEWDCQLRSKGLLAAHIITHYVLSEQDISLIRQRRGDHNRLGIALQLALLRFPGTALLADEAPPQELIISWRCN
jgi:TnpA family transposase